METDFREIYYLLENKRASGTLTDEEMIYLHLLRNYEVDDKEFVLPSKDSVIFSDVYNNAGLTLLEGNIEFAGDKIFWRGDIVKLNEILREKYIVGDSRADDKTSPNEKIIPPAGNNFDNADNDEENTPQKILARYLAETKESPFTYQAQLWTLFNWLEAKTTIKDPFHKMRQYIPCFSNMEKNILNANIISGIYTKKKRFNAEVAESDEFINAVGIAQACPIYPYRDFKPLYEKVEELLGSDSFNCWKNKVLTAKNEFNHKLMSAITDLNQQLPTIDADFVKYGFLKFENTDEGNGKRFYTAYSTNDNCRCLYQDDASRWAVYQTPYWRIAEDKTCYLPTRPLLDLIDALKNPVRDVIKKIETDLSEILGKDIRGMKLEKIREIVQGVKLNDVEERKVEKLVKDLSVAREGAMQLQALQQRRIYTNALETARSYCNVSATMFNNQDFLLNTLNGVVNLKTGEVFPPNPKYFFTQCADAEYRKGYRDPVVDKFLKEILPDEETREAVLTFLGYCLTGSVQEEKMMFFYGSGRNGKGTLTRLLQNVFGCQSHEFSTSLKADVLFQTYFKKDGNAPDPELAKLEGKRLAIIEECPKGRRLDEALFKILTGGDNFSARFLNQNPRMIDPHFKLIVSGNFLPELDNCRDFGLQERMMFVPFTQTFDAETRNIDLKRKLATRSAKCGFLSLLVDYAVKWTQTGLFESAEMLKAKTEYLAENDFAGEFIAANFVRDPNASISRRDLLNMFQSRNKDCRMTPNEIIQAFKAVDGLNYKRLADGYHFFGIARRSE